MHKPLVSVAIITYNQKAFLRECLESVLNQDYENIEIVVADDGSTDGTHEMLKEYEEKYPNRFVLKLTTVNKGITKNSNVAHFACTGKYIAWLGGDDIMFPSKISKQVAYLEANPNCSIVYHNLDVFDSKTDKTLRLRNHSKNVFEGDVTVVLKEGTFNGASSTMIRADKRPIAGFDERIPIASDWLYWAETLLNGGEIHYIDEILGRYRRHDSNITNGNSIIKNNIDHLNSCTILLLKAPQYHPVILLRYSLLLRSLRLVNKDNYIDYIKSSLRISFTFKALIYYVLYYVSFGKLLK